MLRDFLGFKVTTKTRYPYGFVYTFTIRENGVISNLHLARARIVNKACWTKENK